MQFASWKEHRSVAAALKPIYQGKWPRILIVLRTWAVRLSIALVV
jgi:hypothetical protein